MSPSGKLLRLIAACASALWMKGGMKNKGKKKKKEKRELCTFLVLWWMNLMPLIHTLLSCFFSTSVFLMFSVSTQPIFSIRCIHPFDLLELVSVFNMKFTNTVFVETKGSFTLNVLLHSAVLLFHYFSTKMIDMFDCCGRVLFQLHRLQLHSCFDIKVYCVAQQLQQLLLPCSYKMKFYLQISCECHGYLLY